MVGKVTPKGDSASGPEEKLLRSIFGEKGYKFAERMIDTRTLNINVPPETAFNPIQHIGGEKGWYAWNILWQLRGLMGYDLL